MTSFSAFIKKNIIRKSIFYFIIVMIVLDLSLLFVNRYYYQQDIIAEEEAFAEMVHDLTNRNGFYFAIDYMDVYAEKYNVAVKYYYSGEYIYESSKTSRDYNIYRVGDVGDFVQIDSSTTKIGTVFIGLMFASNVISIAIFAAALYIYYRHSIKRAQLILSDFSEMLININDRNFPYYKYNFSEYQRIYDEYVTMYNELKTSRLLKATKLQSITHDLKTSLTVSRSYLEGALNGRLELTNNEIEQLLEEVKFTNSLVEALRNDLENQHEDVNISNILGRVLDTFKSVYAAKNIRLKTLIRPDLIVHGEEESIYRIAQNLLSNSYYYSDNNTVVSVNLYKDKNRVVFEVIDQGIGIPEEEIENIFKKNYRVSSNKSHNPKGSGIGMYIVKVLIDDMGADIKVKSDGGTSIRITFSS